MEPLRPATPNPTGTATVEPLPLGSAPLYPQFLRPLGADPLTVNDPGQFFPDGVPGYEPANNPYATSPFFPAIPESPLAAPLPTNSTASPPEGLQRPALMDAPEATVGELPPPSPETVRSSLEVPQAPVTDAPEVPRVAPIAPEQTAPLAQDVAPAVADAPSIQAPPAISEQVVAQGERLPEPSPPIAPQLARETETAPNFVQASNLPDLAPERQETIQAENLVEPNFVNPAQNRVETASALAEVPENTEQSRPEENLERVPVSETPQPTLPTTQPNVIEEQQPLTAVPTEEISGQGFSENQISPPAPISEPIPERAPGNEQVATTETPRAVPEMLSTEMPRSTPAVDSPVNPEIASEVGSPENTGEVPETIPLGNVGSFPQTPEARLAENPAERPAQSSEGNAATLPESLPQIVTPERSQFSAVPVPKETAETVAENFPEQRLAENPETTFRQAAETRPVESPTDSAPMVPAESPADSAPMVSVESPTDSSPIIPTEIPEQVPAATPTRIPEGIATERPVVASPLIFEEQPADSSEQVPETTPEASPVTSAMLMPEGSREGISQRVLDVVSPEDTTASLDEVPVGVPLASPVATSRVAPEIPETTAENAEATAETSEQNLETVPEIPVPTLEAVPETIPTPLLEPESTTVPVEPASTEPIETATAIPEQPADPINALSGQPTAIPEQPVETNNALPTQPNELSPRQPEMLSGHSPEAISEEIPSAPEAPFTEVPGQRLDNTVGTPETRTENQSDAVLPSQNQRLEQAQVPQNIVPETPPKSSVQTPELPNPVDSPTQRTERTETEGIDVDEDVVPNIVPPSAVSDDARLEPVSASIPVVDSTETPTTADTIGERSAQSEPAQEIPEQTQPLPSISENADLQEQAQALYGALANRLVRLESGAPASSPTETLSAQEPEAVSDTQSAVPAAETMPEVAIPTPEETTTPPSFADLSDQLDEEGQAALTNLVRQSDGVTPTPAALLAAVTDRLPPDAVPALENMLQSGALPVAEAQQSETQLPVTQQPEAQQAETQLPEHQPLEIQPSANPLAPTQALGTQEPTTSTDSVGESSQENLPVIAPPAALLASGDVPAEEPQEQAQQAEQPPANFRGAAALAALQDLPLSMFAEGAPTQEEPEFPESPTEEPQEIAPQAVTPTESSPEDSAPNLETPPIPDQPTQTTAALETFQTSTDTAAEPESLQPAAPQAIEPVGQVESAQPLDTVTQPIQDEEPYSLLPQNEEEEAAPLSQNLGLGMSPFLPTVLDNLSSFTPLDATEASTLQANFQNFAPLTFAPPPQSSAISEDTLQLPTIPEQPQSVPQPQSAIPTEAPQIAEAPAEPVSDFDAQTQEVQLPDPTQEPEQSQEENQRLTQTQDSELFQEHQIPTPVQDLDALLEPEAHFPPATMVGTPADQEESAFLGSMFAAAEPLGQAALDSLVQMPEARQLEISNALPLARRPAQLAETPTPQVPTQQLQTSTPTQPFFNVPNQESFEQPAESELAFEGDQQPVQPDNQNFLPPAAPTYPQATPPLEFASPQTTPQATTTPQIFEQTTPGSPSQGYVQSTQPLVYRPASTPQADSSLADETKPVIDQSGIEEMLNLGTDNHYEAPEAPSFENEPSSDENDTPLGQLFRQGIEKGPPLQRDTTSQEPDASPAYTMESPGQEDDDDDYGGGSGASIESLARRIYHMVRHRIDREKERHGGHQDRGGW